MATSPVLSVVDVRRADELILAGEAVRVTVRVRPRQAGTPPGWEEKLASPNLLAEFDSAGKEVVKEKLGADYRVTVEPSSVDALLYRVVAYRRLGGDNVLQLWHGGRQLDQKMLRTMAQLTTKVEEIGSEAAEVSLIATAEWEPGPGLSPGAGGVERGRGDEDLQGRIYELSLRARAIRARFQIGAGVGVALIIGGLVGGLLFGLDRETTGGVAGYGLAFVLVAFLFRTRLSETEQEVTELRDQQDLRDLLEERERRAQKQFQIHSHQLRRYYDQALRQRGAIFWVGVLCILAGFGIIVAAGLFITRSSSDLDEQIVVAALGATGGILANFIGVMYLRMFTETVKSIGGFHDRLVLTHHLHFANVLAAKVADDPMRDQTLAEMARSMAVPELTDENLPPKRG